MKCYRISKYDPDKKGNANYLESQWTSISDVGKIFGNITLSLDEYLHVENQYLSFIQEFLCICKVDKVRIEALENSRQFRWKNGQKIDIKNAIVFCKGALREMYWGKLESDNVFIHFGYDYYIYVGSFLDYVVVNEIANRNELFCESISSPYI